jgi:hypothetical protein
VVLILVIGGLAFAVWGRGAITDEWGPMAVSRERVGGDFARTEGVLRISDQCVVLESGGRDGTSDILVWWRDQVRWDPDERRILFQKRDGNVIQLRDGQYVSAGGSGGRNVAAFDWAAEPDRNCPPHSYWSVGDMSLGPSGP